MSTGLQYLDMVLGIAVFAAMLWWIFSLTVRPRAERRAQLAVAKAVRQPWADDKAGGRGNR